MIYGAETWALTSQIKNKLAAAQTKMDSCMCMLNITYQDRKTIFWVRVKTQVTTVMEQVRRRKWTWQGSSAGYEITDGHFVSPPGNPTKGKDLEEDGETNWTTTGRVPSGRGYSARQASSRSRMLRPSPNHETLWLHNDDGDDECLITWLTEGIIITINYYSITLYSFVTHTRT